MDPEDESGELSCAAQTGHVETAKHLVKKGEVDAKDKTSKKPSSYTGKARRDSDTYKCFEEMDLGDEFSGKVRSSPSKKELDFESGYSFRFETMPEIVSAATGGDLKAVKRLMKQVPPLESYWSCLVRHRAVVHAAEGGHLDVMKYLVENGGHLDEFELSRALHHAAEGGHLDVVKYLVENCGQVDEDDERALHIAVKAGHVDIVKYLVVNGAEVNAMDTDGQTALRKAASEGHVDIVKYLVENGAEVNAVDTDGKTALRKAASAGHVDIVKYLVENGAQVNGMDTCAETALHIAAKTGNVDFVKYLVENGAQVNAVDTDSFKSHVI